ncbi:MAG: extracellular solute-binding protein [Mobilitalea sp.]
MKDHRNHKYLSIFIGFAVCILLYLFIHMRNNSAVTVEDNPADKVSIVSQEKTVLDYYIWDDEFSYINPVVTAYNAFQSAVEIKLHILTSEEYDAEIFKLLSTDCKIDLLGIRGISKLIMLQDNGQLLDLTSYVKNNDMDVTAYGSMFNDISIDGKYYGIPNRSTCWALFYNKDIFDDAGIPYPEQMTWEEYRQLAITLTRGEGEDKIWGGYWVPWCYNFAALQRSSYLIDDDLTYTKESLELLNNFYNVDKSHMSYRQLVDESVDCYREFENGSIAMFPQGEWSVNMLLLAEKEGLTDVNWDIAPMPVFEGQASGTTWGQYQFVGAASDTAYPKEVFDFIQFLCGEEGARIYAENGMLHAYSNDEIKKIYMTAVGKDSASIFFKTKKVQEEIAMSGYEDVKVSFIAAAGEYLLGNQTIEETMATFIKERKELLK